MQSGFVTYQCGYCSEENETFVDPSAGMEQTYVEDCSVCCRPNVIRLSIDESSNALRIEVEFEG
jgi:hypothetical protein